MERGWKRRMLEGGRGGETLKGVHVRSLGDGPVCGLRIYQGKGVCRKTLRKRKARRGRIYNIWGGFPCEARPIKKTQRATPRWKHEKENTLTTKKTHTRKVAVHPWEIFFWG